MKLYRVTVDVDKELFNKKIKEDQEGFSKQIMTGIAKKFAEDLINPEKSVVAVGSYDSPTSDKDVIVDAHFIGITVEDFKEVYDALEYLKNGTRGAKLKEVATKAFDIVSNKGEIKWEKNEFEPAKK